MIPQNQFKAACEAAGLVPGEIIADGKIHRCPTLGKERGHDGAYIFHADPPASGWYQNYRTGQADTWSNGNGKPLTPAESEALKRRIEADKKARQEETAKRQAEARARAKEIWEAAPPCPPKHPYFERKGIQPHGVRKGRDGQIIVAVRDEKGAVMSLQFIGPDGGKRFLTGGQIRGGYFVIGTDKAGKLYICEGFATGASIHEATGATVLVAFDCVNLAAVAAMARRLYSKREIIIGADDDRQTPGNPGITKATQAAKETKALLAVPVFTDPESGTDFNDLHTAEGLEKVKACLDAAGEPGAVQADPGKPCAPVPFDCQSPPQITPDMMPGILCDFPRALAETVQVPFELALINALGAAAVAVQRKIRVQIREGYAESLNIYALCALPPGERKSAVVEACKRPLVEWQTVMRREMADEIKGAESERKSLEKAIDAKRNRIALVADREARQVAIEEIKGMEQELPEIPVAPRLLADDFTPEAMAVLMDRHDQRIGVVEAEGGLFETLAGRYSNGVPNLDAVLKFWSGEACQIDRKGREAIYLDDPHLTLCISPQPDVIRSLADKPGFRGRGLIGRFLYVMPESRLGGRLIETRPVPFDVSEAWRQTLLGLLSLPWALDEHGEKTAFIVHLDRDAYILWRQFAEKVETEMRGEFECMTDWAGKFPGQAVRLAGLIHCATVAAPHITNIGLETMRAALGLAAILADHAKAAYSLMGSDPAQECAKSILRWIERDHVERFTARDALRAVRGRFPTMEAINPGLTVLEERGFVFPVEMQRGGAGRKPRGT